jgi:hypothetical protein
VTIEVKFKLSHYRAPVQVVLAGASQGRSASLSAFSVSRCKLHLPNTGSLLEFLVPLLEGHPPFQTGAGFANRLRIQSHTPTGWGIRRWKRKCCACRNYRASKRDCSLSGYWNPCSTKLLCSPKISKKWRRPVCPHVSPMFPGSMVRRSVRVRQALGIL